MGSMKQVRTLYEHFNNKQKEHVFELLNLMNPILKDWWGRI